MAEKSKDRRPEPVTQKTGLEEKVRDGEVRRSVAPVPRTEAPPKAQQATSPKRATTAQEVTAEDRWSMIATAAYYRAEKRGFVGGDPAQDWSEAEAEIDALLASRRK